MIKILKEENKKINIYSNYEIDLVENTWTHLTAPNVDLLRELSKKTDINIDLLITCVDEEETAHIDFNKNTTLIVVDIPYLSDNFFSTIPFFILYNEGYYITVCSKEIDFTNKVIEKITVEPHKHIRLTIQILYRISYMYIESLRKLDEMTRQTEEKLVNSMKNKELFNLMNINKSLVYFSTALNSNKMLLNKLDRLEEFKKYEQDYELMDDLKIEHDQAVEMCQIYRDILSGSMESFSSIISNNLNNSMQSLAIITLSLSFPTLIASIFGMNMVLPFAQYEYSFYFVIAFSFMLSFFGGYIIFRFTNKRNFNK